MKAGEIHIAVTAQMQAFNASMAQVEASAANSGNMAGMNFANTFEMSTQKVAMNFLKQFASPMFVASIADSVAEGLRNGFSMTNLQDALKKIPFAGSFVNLGGAIFDSLESVRGDVNEWYRSVGLGFMADVNEAVYGVATSTERQQMAAQAAAESQQSIAQSAKSAEESYKKIAEIDDQRRRAQISRGDNERKTILDLARLDMERIADESREYIELQQARIEVLDGAAQEAVRADLEAARKLRDARIAQVIEERDEKLKALDVAFVRETERLMELDETKRKQQEEAEKREKDRIDRLAEQTSKQFVEQFSNQMDEIDGKIAEVEEARMGVARSQTTASTALGSFTVSSYTDAEKKKIDSESLKELKRLRQSMENVGAGGFR